MKKKNGKNKIKSVINQNNSRVSSCTPLRVGRGCDFVVEYF